MAIRQRDNNVKNTGVETFEVQEEVVTFTPEEIQSFTEEACMVLDIMDKNGIDLYSKDRTPGMYLKQRYLRYYGLIENDSFKKIFNKGELESKDSNSPISDDTLKSFFK